MATIRFNCAQCGQPLEAPEEGIGVRVPCPTCGTAVIVAPTSAPTPGASPLCGYCHAPVLPGEEKATCPTCQAAYHAECWRENGGCGVYGCTEVPTVEPRRALEIPVSFWGQENKPCPACGREILAAAVRCRHCGATFASAQPEDSAAFQNRAALEQRLPRLRHHVAWLFIVCLLPCLAPVGAVWGLVWYPSNRRDVEALPSLYPALCKIGIGVAVVQTLLMVLMGVLYATVRGH